VVHAALSQKPYTSKYLLRLIDKYAFKKLSSFEVYNKAVDDLHIKELEWLSKNQRNRENFMQFVRYVDILDPTDQHHIEGKKLINKIANLEEFKLNTNQSLNVLDYES
jgi:hypothetical protein